MKKRVLFIGITRLDFEKNCPVHLKKQFIPMSEKVSIWVMGRGTPFYKEIWGVNFYLFPNRLLYLLLAFPLAFYLCLTKKIDVVVAQSPLVEGLIGSLLKIILRKELIVAIHGDWVEGPFLSRKRKCEALQRKIVPLLAKFSLKSADKIRGVAEYLIAKAKKISPNKKYFNFPTFTDLDIFLEEKNYRFDPFILFVGYLQEVKGAKYLIDAFREVSDDFPEFKLVIIGDGSEKEALENKVSGIGLGNKVEFKGKLPLGETKEVMRRCYCLVLPSLSEGLPRVILEAMALAKPVIASNVGGIPDLVKNSRTGFTFSPGNSSELAERLKALLSDKDRAVDMGREGRALVEESFSNKKHNEAYIEMIYS